MYVGFPGGSVVKNLQETRVPSLGPKIPWRRKWQPTPVFLPGESHGQRSLVGNSSWGHKELDTTEHLSINSLTKTLKTLSDPPGEEKLPTSVLEPGEFHGLYNPCGLKQSDTTE